MSPFWIRVSRGYRRRQLARDQRIVRVDCDNLDVLQRVVADGSGVLITPNHSVHHDSAALYLAADQINQPMYFMAAWQVFAMSSKFQCWALRHLGCFSIDREGNDRQAFKQAVQILQDESEPLVIFPEGDIYHTTDYVTPFREGAAAIALSAAKRSQRPIVALPCGIKFWYVEDPTEELLETVKTIEERLHLRPEVRKPLPERIHRLAEAALALKELDYLGHTSAGRLRDRIRSLTEFVISELEHRHDLSSRSTSTPPERIKALRQCVIQKLEEHVHDSDDSRREELYRDMDDMFFAMQLYSYRGDYLADNPSIERLAETVDKFEEDILQLDYPNVRGRRRVAIHFGDAVPVSVGENRRDQVAELTRTLQTSVQVILDEMNSSAPA